MTFTSRIRLFLLLVAILPPIAIIMVINLYTDSQIRQTDRKSATVSLLLFKQYNESYQDNLKNDVQKIFDSPVIKRVKTLAKSNRVSQIDLGNDPIVMDFIEIVDSGYSVIASYHRPGLNGRVINNSFDLLKTPFERQPFGSIEYDINGIHTAYTFLVPIDSNLYLYCGKYIGLSFIDLVGKMTNAEVQITVDDSISEKTANMKPGILYQEGSKLQSLLVGGELFDFNIEAYFHSTTDKPSYKYLIWLSGLVALGSVLFAIVLGMLITGKAKKEIENLTRAAERISTGDFSKPVMAYEEGEFSQLADSFTDMTLKLKKIQRDLATTEKIAAWQIMGRKVAHEIKNPLTPIAVSIDDLRRSYQEKLDNFPEILLETTGTIKTEIVRLTKLLDQFVKFARMNPPVIIKTSFNKIISDIETLYRNNIDSKRLIIKNSLINDIVNLDPEMITQTLINLIKNSLEAGSETTVTMEITNDHNNLNILTTDNGPGFPEEILKQDLQPYLSTKKDGSGLGLVICQRIINDHGGTFEIFNTEYGGAGIRIIIPQQNG
ncbi:MAG: ATP-binding protein [bacterium]